VEPPASKEGFQMQEQFGAKDTGVKILSEFGAPKWAKAPGVEILSLGQKTPE
jgi:hypothetical protein